MISLQSIEIFYGHTLPAYVVVVPRLGERIGQLVQASGRQQKSIALKAGIDPAVLNRIITGRIANPGFEIVAKIARELNVSLDVIAGDAARPESADTLPPDRSVWRYRRLLEALEQLDDTSRARIARFAEWTARTIASVDRGDAASAPHQRNQRRG